MKLSGQLPKIENIPWFKRWFDSAYYHKLYGSRDQEEATFFINNLDAYLEPQAGSNILDVGCGAGRHCKELASKGYKVTGLDLSSSSIREAKKCESDSLRFFRHDMRDPFGTNQFDYVFNFFTSFGYFKTPEENDRVVRNISQALKRHGTLVLDYMNVRYVEERLIPYEEKEIDGIIYYITRWMDENYFYKKIKIVEEQSGIPLENIEQVARFTLEDFKRMFCTGRLCLKEVFGDYELNAFNEKSSPRLIAIVQKEL